MAREEVESGRDDMIVDGCEAQQQGLNNVVFDGVNVNYLKVYYGTFLIVLAQ